MHDKRWVIFIYIINNRKLLFKNVRTFHLSKYKLCFKMVNFIFLSKTCTFTLQGCRENSDLVTRAPEILKGLGRKIRSEVKSAETLLTRTALFWVIT